MRKLICLLGMFILLSSFIKFTYGVINEFGDCKLKIQEKEAGIISEVVSWYYENNDLYVRIGETYKNIIHRDKYTLKNLSSVDNIIEKFPLIEVPTLTSNYNQKYGSDSDKKRYLDFKKASIKDKDGEKNVMEFNIVTSAKTTPTKDEATTSRHFKILAQQSYCRVRYEHDGKILYGEHLPVIDMSNNFVTKWWNIKPYIIYSPLVAPFPIEASLDKFIPKKPKGVCFFDIDGTLSQDADYDKNQGAILACLKRGFLVGIITASQRSIAHTCDEPYISKDLCDLITRDNSYMYNNASMRSGEISNKLKDFHPYNVGHKKAYQAHYWWKKYFPDMPDKCIILFDDDNVLINQYKDYAKLVINRLSDIDKDKHDFSFFLTDEINHPLSAKNVAAKVSHLIANGCDKEITPSFSEADTPISTSIPDGGLETKAQGDK
ncbi:MAG: hypothetical protein K0R14_1730 [Burkholderiales bacterium]|jgi:hypothetical protein|nr:hypothetical protein [Burkholderiales bacterium]